MVDGFVIYTTAEGQTGAVEAESEECVRTEQLSSDPLAPADTGEPRGLSGAPEGAMLRP